MNMHPRSNAVFNEKTNEAAFLQEFIIYNVYLGIPPYRTTKQIKKKKSVQTWPSRPRDVGPGNSSAKSQHGEKHRTAKHGKTFE